MAAKFGVPVCPHAGGVGLCELVQHLSMFDYMAVSGRMDDRVTEFVDHLHEHFVDPVVIRHGRYQVAERARATAARSSANRGKRTAFPAVRSGPHSARKGINNRLMAGTLSRRNFLSFDFGDRARDPDHWVRIHRIAMACRFEVMLSSDDVRDMAAARSALDEADDLEALLTAFRDGSVVSDLNRRAAREDVTVGVTVFGLLTRSAELHTRTGGAFDVTATPLSRCWDFLQREGRAADGPGSRRGPRGRRHARTSAWTRRSAASASRVKAWSSTSPRSPRASRSIGWANCCAAAARGARCCRRDTAACWRSAARGAAGRSTCARGWRAAASGGCGSRTARSAPAAPARTSSKSTGSATVTSSIRAPAVSAEGVLGASVITG